MSALQHLNKIKKQLRYKAGKSKTRNNKYFIPYLWVSHELQGKVNKLVNVNPFDFFLDAIRRIEEEPKQLEHSKQQEKWTNHAVVYNMMIRTTCAFDHNQNGTLDLPCNDDGWRETGTFLKAIALLPYIKSLGANTVHLLPITSIGMDGRKGTLGSPYATKDPYKLDTSLSEPNLELEVEEEFKAFVEAAHHLEIRVVLEFVFRTTSKDSDWIKQSPDWFYWIKGEIPDRITGSSDEMCYGPPVFSNNKIELIRKQVENGHFSDLEPPNAIYRHMFTEPPERKSVIIKNGKYVGTLKDGTRVRIPGAFADWPPDDLQPPWGDVTYLKMYNHPDFNYMAYNTLRMYDIRLSQPENAVKPLWETITDIVPYYQRTFNIDGVMIDMGHALPIELKQKMIQRAREIDPDFVFWGENFSVTEESRKEGYNAVMGYQWADQHYPVKFKLLLKRFSSEGYPLPFFATPESHNTPRAITRNGSMKYAKYAWAVSNFIPAIPFIHSGFELAEALPINSGLDFTPEELLKYPLEKLPLFSEYAFNWLNEEQFILWIQKVSSVRRKYEFLIVDSSKDSFYWMETDSPDVIIFRRGAKHSSLGLLVTANSNLKSESVVSIDVGNGKEEWIDLLSGQIFPIKDNSLHCKLKPGQVCVFEDHSDIH